MKSDKIVFKTIVVLLLLFAFSVSSALCGYAGDDSEMAKKLIAQSVEAMGGLEKATSWNTRIETGHLVSIWEGWGTLNANCTQHTKKPDKMKIDQDYSAYNHPFFMTYYCNGEDVWVNVNLGIRQHPRYTEQMTNTMRRVDGLAYFLTACDTFYLVNEIPDDSLFTGSTLSRVGVVDQGDTLLFDIDNSTMLPVRRIEESGNTHLIMEDYRDVAGLKVPFHVTGYHGGVKAIEYTWEDISFDKPIDDAVFEENRPAKTE